MLMQLIWVVVALVAMWVAFARFRHLAHHTPGHHLDFKLMFAAFLFLGSGFALSYFGLWPAAFLCFVVAVCLAWGAVTNMGIARQQRGYPSAMSG